MNAPLTSNIERSADARVVRSAVGCSRRPTVGPRSLRPRWLLDEYQSMPWSAHVEALRHDRVKPFRQQLCEALRFHGASLAGSIMVRRLAGQIENASERREGLVIQSRRYLVGVRFRRPRYRGIVPMMPSGSKMSRLEYEQWRDLRTWDARAGLSGV